MALSICYIISNFAVVNVAACQTFSFLLHFTLLLNCGAIAILLIFMIYTQYTDITKRVIYFAPIFLNLGEHTKLSYSANNIIISSPLLSACPLLMCTHWHNFFLNKL